MSTAEPTTQPRSDLGRPMVFVLVEDERDLPVVPLALALGEVTALSVAPPSPGDTTLARARALGAERAVRIWDPLLAEIDYLAVAHVLACAVRHLCDARGNAPVIVLCHDRGRGAVGPAVAERLQVPYLGAVQTLELAREVLLVDRCVGAMFRRYRGSAPVVLGCVPTQAPTPSEPGETSAGRVEVLDLSTLRVTSPELQYRRRFKPVPGEGPSRRPHLVASVERLRERLQRDGLWPIADAQGQGDRR